MNLIISWFAQNRVAANLLMLIILVVGLYSVPQLRREIVPNMKLDSIAISVPYFGASPTEIESAICSRIEAAVSEIDGIDRIVSFAAEDIGTTTLYVDFDYSAREVLEQVKAKIDSIQSLPVSAEKPIVAINNFRAGVAKIMVFGKTNEKTLKKIAEKIRLELVDMPQISQAEITDSRPYEVSVEVSKDLMLRYGVTFDDITNAISSAAIDVPGGIIHTERGEVSVITLAQVQDISSFENIILKSYDDGGRVVIADVAQVIDGLEGRSVTRFNGEPAVSVSVYRVGNEKVTDISETMQQYINKVSPTLPDGIKLSLYNDTASIFTSCLDLLVGNAITGLILVFIMLLLFLRTRLSFWVSAGIPISFLGTLALLPFFDGSLNMISLFAFILVLGIVVDDAIVVGESIFLQHQKGVFGVKASIQGTLEVYKPVIFATLTTIVAFSSLLFFEGSKGRLISILPIVVILTLIVSLVESLLILPAHLSEINSLKKNRFKWLNTFREQFNLLIENIVEHVYKPALEAALKIRYIVLAIFIGAFIICGGLSDSGLIGTGQDQDIEAESVASTVVFSMGTSIEKTKVAVKQLEIAAISLKQELKNEFEYDQIKGMISTAGAGSSDNIGEVIIELTPSEHRMLSADEIAMRWRIKAGKISGAIRHNYISSFSSAKPRFSIELSGSDIKQIKSASIGLKKILTEYDGVYEIEDSFELGRPELKLSLKNYAKDLGISETELARQVRQEFFGIVAQNIQKGQDEVKVIVRYPKDSSSTLWDLEHMMVKLPDGSETPLISIADIQYGKAPIWITRENGKRLVNVSAAVNEQLIPLDKLSKEVYAKFLVNLQKDYPGVSWKLSGYQKNQEDFSQGMVEISVICMLVMYVLMAVAFKSYAQPLIVMSAIPFGAIGAILGHLITGVELSTWSNFGLLAVFGVVVNDNLVLIDAINKARRAGETVDQAVRSAGALRFRPIVLTSITTFVGLLPMISERSWQAQFLIPMAVSLAFGVLFATVLSLFLVPSLYKILEDSTQWFLNKRAEISRSVGVMAGGAPQDLDEAYNLGYAAGLSGKPNSCPFKVIEITAGWEAGWGDGYEEYIQNRGNK